MWSPLHEVALGRRSFDFDDPDLLERGLLLPSQLGSFPLHFACLGELEVAHFMLESGANANQLNQNLESPLHWAARFGKSRIIDFLLRFGAQLNSMDKDGATALSWALEADQPRVVRQLLAAGADLTLATRSIDPFLFCCRNGCGKSIRVLLRMGMATPPLEDLLREGWWNHHAEVVEALLEFNSSLRAKAHTEHRTSIYCESFEAECRPKARIQRLASYPFLSFESPDAHHHHFHLINTS